MDVDETNDNERDWLAVIAKCLCFLSLKHANLEQEEMLAKVHFLKGLGLSRSESAAMLGTTANSIGVLQRRALLKKGKSNGKRGK